jgi:hypothetical protein
MIISIQHSNELCGVDSRKAEVLLRVVQQQQQHIHCELLLLLRQNRCGAAFASKITGPGRFNRSSTASRTRSLMSRERVTARWLHMAGCASSLLGGHYPDQGYYKGMKQPADRRLS